MKLSHAIILKLMRMYLDGMLDPFMEVKEFFPILYFMKKAGETTIKIDENYDQVSEWTVNTLKNMEKESLIYKDNTHVNNSYPYPNLTEIFPCTVLKLAHDSVDKADNFLIDHPETIDRLNKVKDLIEGFESEVGLKMLAQTYWFLKDYMTIKKFNIAQKRLIEKGWIS